MDTGTDTFEMWGDEMTFSELCKAVKPACPSLRSQKTFIQEMTKAAGNQFYESDSYFKQLFSGRKQLTDNLKLSLRGKDNLVALTAFFEARMVTDRVPDVVAALGIPETGTPNKHALAIALAVQLRTIVDCDDANAPDVLISVYQDQGQGQLQKTPAPAPAFIKPLYPGDDAYVGGDTTHVIKSTDVFQHRWSLINTGTQAWIGRKLVYIRNPDIDRPEADPAVVEIPDVQPKAAIGITTTFDGRGFDGVFHCKWEMQDSEGRNCFPGRQLMFCVTIDAKYKRP